MMMGADCSLVPVGDGVTEVSATKTTLELVTATKEASQHVWKSHRHEQDRDGTGQPKEFRQNKLTA